MDIQFVNDDVVLVHDFLHEKSVEFPRLVDVLPQINHKGRIEIELKSYDTHILEPLKHMLDTYTDSDIELTTSEIPLAPHIKRYFENLKLGLILRENIAEEWMTHELVTQKMSGWGRMVRADVLHLPYRTIERFGGPSLVNTLHTDGFLVHTHLSNVDDQADRYETIIKWGVDQCTVDGCALFKKTA